ncbi:GNAT family N-acetyltransferase [Aquibacillus koreensis]|uniref:GNAT family N-acetyltransferase n=1 Tax=Aquibacillus koreensis TaxID=279446 RepID=A0A9X3WKA2_9BACI|nr:GNAT family N-acetyltransferase [Aquibacillus koreensis]MCT2535532.1 GNAT family N-acetyltransferase [Aquibacillus koreensis]MDC3420183.1 GNAT family N-acetyltransferase [Aquibacillus koreensis]
MYQIRKAKLEDAEKIADIHVKSWKSTYSELINEKDMSNITYENRKTLWETVLSMPMHGQVALVVLDQHNQIVGFISGGKERTKRFGYDGEIYAIYLLDAFQRKGLGAMMLEAFAKEMNELEYKSLLVWVLTQNPSSKFYIDHGAKQIEEEETTIGKGTYQETAFGWESIDALLKRFE